MMAYQEENGVEVSPANAHPILQALNEAIARAPQMAVNYLLRGEHFFNNQEFYLAYEDFKRAVELAETGLQSSTWGFVDQAVRDQALDALRTTRRRMR